MDSRISTMQLTLDSAAGVAKSAAAKLESLTGSIASTDTTVKVRS